MEEEVADPPAYSCVPEERGKCVAETLLYHSLAWALSAGFKRLAVDFESANWSAARFWNRHFRPVCSSLLRRIDERALGPANK